MKKKFKDTAIGRFAIGAIGAYVKPLGGLVAGVSAIKRDNINSEQGGVGKLDKSQMSGSVFALLVLAGIIAVAAGWITTEKLNAVLEAFGL